MTWSRGPAPLLGSLFALLLLMVMSVPGAAFAQVENGSEAQSNAKAPPIEDEPAEPEASAEPQASLPDIEDEVNCIVCGVTLDRATEAPQALQQRELINELIAQGLTKDEIKDQLVVEYGDDVLATPATSGFDLFAWLVPGVVVVVAAIGIFVGLRRWRSNGPGGGAGGDGGNGPGGSTPAIAAGDRKRLDEELERYGI